MRGADLVRVGPDRLRFGPWRADRRMAYITPLPDAGPPTVSAVRRCVELIGAHGYRGAVTAALTGAEQAAFLAVGFEVREHLHLLAHELADLPDPVPAPLRRARRADRQAVLAVDFRAFPTFWRLDESGLADALAATPSSRLRVAADPGVIAYAIAGRAGRRGYLQRLAVDPERQGGGLGTALVVDALRWMRRRGADRAVVNTQEDNRTALSLYEGLGFRRQPNGLAVLHTTLGTA